MKRAIGLVFSIILIVVGCYLMYDGAVKPYIENKRALEQFDTTSKQLLSPGEVFEVGKYIEVDGVEILYNGKSFLVTSNRDDFVRVTCSIVGVKNDGTYDTIQLPGFGGVDKTQYERDKSENGWAIEKTTNLIRPNETLDAKLTIFDFNDADSSYPKNDIDGDGYIDIVFTVHPQPDETSIVVSSNDVASETYKIKNTK